MLWRPGMKDAELFLIEPQMLEELGFAHSPIKALYDGAEGIRQRLDMPEPPGTEHYSIYDDLIAEGITDYVALPMTFTDGKRHAATWATKQAGGFTTADLVEINDIMHVLALVIEVRMNRRITKNLLNAYVGQHAGARILSGDIRRGSGATVQAAIWNCDLRGFTRISEQWPRDDVITWLNEYFDVMAAPVERHGGEILKFVGDGMLAIFRLDHPDACNQALQAAVVGRIGRLELTVLDRQPVVHLDDGLGHRVALEHATVLVQHDCTDHQLRHRLAVELIDLAVLVDLQVQVQRTPQVRKDHLATCAVNGAEPFAVLAARDAEAVDPAVAQGQPGGVRCRARVIGPWRCAGRRRAPASGQRSPGQAARHAAPRGHR